MILLCYWVFFTKISPDILFRFDYTLPGYLLLLYNIHQYNYIQIENDIAINLKLSECLIKTKSTGNKYGRITVKDRMQISNEHVPKGIEMPILNLHSNTQYIDIRF